MSKFLDFFRVNDTSPNIGDAAALGISIASIIEYIPVVSAALSVVWVALRIYVTIRDDVFKKKEKKDANE